MLNGEIFFDMTRETHPVTGSKFFVLKRWKKYTIYAKSGSYNRTDNPTENLYSTNSIYLYDYVIVNDAFYYENVYTASIYDTVPAADSDYSYSVPPDPTVWSTTDLWFHRANTFKNSPNASTNNYLFLTSSFALSATQSVEWPDGTGHPYYGLPVTYRDDGVYFEIVKGYPRNHFTHKRDLFSLFALTSYGLEKRTVTKGRYIRNSQTVSSTIGEDGLEDGTPPVQSTPVGDLNLVQTDNVINQ